MQSFRQFLSGCDDQAIVTTAPCRADLAGGTIDIWPLYLFHPGAVSVNIALEILTACKITVQPGDGIFLKSHDTQHEQRFANLDELLASDSYCTPLPAYLIRFFRPAGGFMLETYSESPAGAGISGSSALMIAASAALARFTGQSLDIERIRVIAQDVEAQLIRVPTGCQDYYPAMYGGVSAIHLEVGGVRREPIRVSAEAMNQRFVLFYTGAPRQSGINNWTVFREHIDGEARVIQNFDELTQVAQAMHHALGEEEWDDVARLIREEWSLRRTNAPGIATPLIDRLIDVARENGALAAKVCGAGGGGCVIALVEPGVRDHVEMAIRQHGGHVLDFRVAEQGLRFHSVTKEHKARA